MQMRELSQRMKLDGSGDYFKLNQKMENFLKIYANKECNQKLECLFSFASAGLSW
jgi:hypothetical protein